MWQVLSNHIKKSLGREKEADVVGKFVSDCLQVETHEVETGDENQWHNHLEEVEADLSFHVELDLDDVLAVLLPQQ